MTQFRAVDIGHDILLKHWKASLAFPVQHSYGFMADIVLNERASGARDGSWKRTEGALGESSRALAARARLDQRPCIVGSQPVIFSHFSLARAWRTLVPKGAPPS